MPKTFHFRTTFDTKVVLQDSDIAVVEAMLAAVDAGSSHAHLIDQQITGTGQPLDDRIVRLARTLLRNQITEIAEEFPEGYSFSPAKVTQVVVPRIQEAAQEELCGGCEYPTGHRCRC